MNLTEFYHNLKILKNFFMKKSELLRKKLTGRVNHIDYATDKSGTQSSGVGAGLMDVARNPKFVSQFDISILPYYTSTEYVTYAPTDDTDNVVMYANGNEVLNGTNLTNLPTALQGKLPAYLFGSADFNSGFKNMSSQMSITNWEAGTPFIVKENTNLKISIPVTGSALPNVATFVNQRSLASYNGFAKKGDLVIPFFYQSAGIDSVPGTFTMYLCEMIVSCKQVGYGTLLNALNSDRFKINMIRYKIPDTTKTGQYENNLHLFRQSLFGKISTDYVSPASFQNPEQFQQGITDIPLVKGMDKESGIGLYNNYDTGEILLSFYVETQDKLVQNI